MPSLPSSSKPSIDFDGQQPLNYFPPASLAPPQSTARTIHNHKAGNHPNQASSSATQLAALHHFDSPANSKIKQPQDQMPASSIPSSNLSRTSASAVFELSDSDEERFLSGLEEQIKDVSMEPALSAQPQPPQASSSRPSRPQSKKVHVIDLTRFDSPPSSSLRKRRFEAVSSFPDKDKKLKLASRPENVLGQSTSANAASKTPSSALVLDLDDELSCPICCELFVSPVNFACGHAFCGSCADAWLQKESVCPTCRRETESSPARMYSMDAMLQKYLKYQAEQLRQSGKSSEALALELEYQERQALWDAQRKRLEAKASASRRAVTRIATGRHPVALPHIHGFGPRLYSPYPRELVAHRAAHERQPVPVEQLIRPPVEHVMRTRERDAVGWHQSRSFAIGPTYSLLAHPAAEAANRMTASGSNHNNQALDPNNDHPHEVFDHVERAWDQLGPFLARS